MRLSFTLVPDELIFSNLLSLSHEERLSDFELCGVYVYENDKSSLIPYIPSEIEIDERKSGECVLQSNNAYAIKWHTHPKKFYPSIADLFVLYKSVQTLVSIIYSTQGFWILQKENQKNTPITMHEYETFYEYETILYMLSRHKDLNGHIQNQKLEKGGGLYLNSLCLHFIEKYYIPIVKKTFGIIITFYKYNTDKKIELNIDINDKKLLHKSGTSKIPSEISMKNLVKSMIPKTFTLIEYSIDPIILNYTYEVEEPQLKKRKSK